METVHVVQFMIETSFKVMGISRKNHIPRAESTYYMEGNTGHRVFEVMWKVKKSQKMYNIAKSTIFV